jgi:hypothetical protein
MTAGIADRDASADAFLDAAERPMGRLLARRMPNARERARPARVDAWSRTRSRPRPTSPERLETARRALARIVGSRAPYDA